MSEDYNQDRLLGAVKNMADLPDKNKVNIRGKLYAEVHTRVQAFREAYGQSGRVISTLHVADETKVLTETAVSVFVDGSWRLIGNDFAEEFRGASMVNKTSAVENCLTSSIGRALACCGLSGGNYASFDEGDHAINEKAKAPAPKKTTPPVSKVKPATAVIISGQKWTLEERMMTIEKKVSVDVEVTLDTIKEVLEFIYVTIVMFALPPEGTPAKAGDPKTAAGWIEEFTKRNRKTLLELYNRGYQNEIKAFNERIEPLRQMSVEELRQLQHTYQTTGETTDG